MAYTVANTEHANYGSVNAVVATLDITSLDGAGAEPVAVADDFGLSNAAEVGVSIRGQESSDYSVTWDHINGALSVVNVADGTDVTAGTDVGEVVAEFIGY